MTNVTLGSVCKTITARGRAVTLWIGGGPVPTPLLTEVGIGQEISLKLSHEDLMGVGSSSTKDKVGFLQTVEITFKEI